MTGDKWGCVCDMTGGDAWAKLGRARHGPPRVVAAVIVAAMSWRDGSEKRNEARRGCGGGVGLLLPAELRLRRRTCTDDDEHAQERSGETAAAVAVDEMSERKRGKGVMVADVGGRQRHGAASSC